MASNTTSGTGAAHPRDQADGPHNDRNDQTRRTLDTSGTPDPKQPHERDESADTAAEPQPRIQQAHDDLQRGLRDTDRGAPMDETYRKQKQ